jgi:hypothetical protein
MYTYTFLLSYPLFFINNNPKPFQVSLQDPPALEFGRQQYIGCGGVATTGLVEAGIHAGSNRD